MRLGRFPSSRSHHVGGAFGAFWMRIAPIVLFGLYFGYYYFANSESVPLTGRTQLVELDREQEMALGLESYRAMLERERVVSGGPLVDQVREIGGRIARAAAEHDPGFDWEFNVIESNQANAFALPGGKTAIYAGLVPIAENVDGLAVVMAHEIAHAIARHGAERMAHQKLAQWGKVAIGASVADMDIGARRAVMGAFGMATQYGALLPFSREHESEADYMGLIYMARACFDPREAPRLWERMAAASSAEAPAEFASTHPSHETRIEQFEEWMPEALAVRAEWCGE